MAEIRYSDNPSENGQLLYIKPIMLKTEPPDVATYKATHGDFPHESTADQWFDESQTESYRMLGLHSICEICDGWPSENGLPGLIEHVRTKYLGMAKPRHGLPGLLANVRDKYVHTAKAG